MNYNSERLMITIIIIFVICIIAWIAIFIVINKILKDKFVKENGEKYKKILHLNNISNLHFLNKQEKFIYKYKTKALLDRANLFDCGIRYINENFEYIKEEVTYYNKCALNYNKYKEEYNKILKSNINYTKLWYKKNPFTTIDSFNKYELKKIKKLYKKYNNNYYLYIYCYYVSPKGKNYWYKEKMFDYNDIVSMIEIIEKRKDYINSIAYQRSLVSDSLRYDVFKRDGFKCKICGSSPKEDGVKLHVDHIIPVSKGGKTVMSNLQTLCERCNSGKSNKL